MIVIHAMNDLARVAATALSAAADVMPVTIITGTRQTGKSTLVLPALKCAVDQQ